MSRIVVFIGVVLSVGAAAQQRSAPRHLLGSASALTGPSARPAVEIGRDFLDSVAPDLGLSTDDLAGAYVAKEYTDSHNGVNHILYRQAFRGIDVLNAAYVVNIDAQGQVLNAGGDLYPAPTGALPSQTDSLAAVRAAVKSVNPSLAQSFQPFSSQQPAKRANAVRFAAGAMPRDVEGRPVWYGVRGKLYGAWVFNVAEADGPGTYSVVVDAASRQVLAKRSRTFYQSAPTPRGLVFDKGSPQPNPKPGTLVTSAPPLVERTLQPFVGDPVASPKGWVENNQTAGNNAIVGENLLGIEALTTITPTKAPDGNFSFPLELGPGAPSTMKFPDAVNTNLFYWVNRAHDSYYKIGFTEAAGNFQQDNFGRGGVGGDPIYAYSHFGAQAPQRAERVNAFFNAMDDTDGSRAWIAMFLSDSGLGGIFTDGSLDAFVITHEYGHGVSDRLLPKGYDTFQVAMMAEAWSDFFAFEFLLPEGIPTDGVFLGGEYFDQSWAQGIRSRPYSTNMDINPLTFEHLGKVIPFPEVHADGEIWMLTLWEARANLIKQFGEKEGRKRMGTLVLDAMKLAPPGSTMLDMRDSILLADRVDYKGASQTQLWAAFAKRGMGATAFSSSGDSVYSRASYALPSDRGQIAFSVPQAIIGDTISVTVHDANNGDKAVPVTLTSSSGDVERITLRKKGDVFTGSFPTSSNIANIGNGTLNLMPGDYISAYYDDASAGGAAVQIQTTIPTQAPYTVTAATAAFEFPAETQIFATSSNPVRIDLPWDFPFFGEKYRSMYVQENGIITFGSNFYWDSIATCPDFSALASIPAIAPMFLNLTTEGVAQANEGVWRTRTIGDSITIRWAGETWTPFSSAGLDGAPVNFAVTLSYDGRIEFRYGKGNTDLGTAYVGPFCGQGPTVGLSPGHDGYVARVLLPAFPDKTSLRWDPPFGTNSVPTAVIETPKAGETVKDVLQVSGVAYGTAAEPVTRVNILIDGIKKAAAAATGVRTDFCSQQNVPGCPRVGWTAAINTADLAPGQHTLQVRVVNSRGGFADYPAQPLTFNTEAGTSGVPIGKLESPTEGANVTGALTVRGYAYAPTLRITSVDTIIDGITYGPTSYGITRNDVCASLNPRPANCPGIGFQLNLNTRSALPPVANGEHQIQIRVRDESGRYTFIPEAPVTFRTDNGARAQTFGAITSPKNGETVSGTIDVAGYIYSSSGTIRTATIAIDDFFTYGTATLNQARPEICANLTDVPACPNIGFTGRLDTRLLSNGPHTLQIYGNVNSGESFRIPLAGSAPISINVKN